MADEGILRRQRRRRIHRQMPGERKGALLVQSAFVVPLDGFEPSSQP